MGSVLSIQENIIIQNQNRTPANTEFMKIIISFLLLFCSTIILVNAQTPSAIDLAKQQQINTAIQNARAEIKTKGLNEATVITKMREKGVDLNSPTIINEDPNRIQRVFQEVIKELEQLKIQTGTPSNNSTKVVTEAVKGKVDGAVTEEKAKEIIENALEDVIRDPTENIEQRVKEGESVEVAIAEKLAENLSEELPSTTIYGQQIFRDKQISQINKSYDVKPPKSYVLGVGDQVTISIFGNSLLNEKYEIAQDGFIRPPFMRPIFLKGISIENAEQILIRNYQQRYQFTPGQFAVVLDVARTITINIVGEVIEPGSYTIPATYTAVSALRFAGGPSDIGSLRNIELIKSDGKRQKLDLYEYLQNPSIAYNFFLEQNDFLYIPTAKKVVGIRGAVKRPLRYELLEKENLLALIDYTGGLNANAYRSNIQVKRFENDRERIINVNLRDLADKKQDFTLLDDDEVVINVIPKEFDNFVKIDGAVQLPNRYELLDSMRILDLVQMALLEKEARTDVLFVKRKRTDNTRQYIRVNLDEALVNPNAANNLLLQAEDEVTVFLQSKYADFATVTVSGAVRNPIEFPFDISENLTLEDAILLAGGLDPEANDYAYLIRKNRTNLKEVDYIRINVRQVMERPNSAENISLMPFDSITVLANPTFTDEFQVQVQGEVRSPGAIKYDKSLTLRDALTLAGGLKLSAAANQIEVFRLIIGEDETRTMVAQVEINENLELTSGIDFRLEPFDLIVVRRKPNFELFKTVRLDGEVKFPGTYALLDYNERIFSVIERSGGLTNKAFMEGATLFRQEDNVGFVIFQLDEVMRDKNSRSNLILKEGDIITIPEQRDLVGIIGATKAPELYPERLLDGKIDVPYHANKRAMFYVNEYAAGISDNGKRSLITVEQPNGRIERTVDLGIAKIYPKVQRGSIIKVGVKPPKEEDNLPEAEREPVNWGQVVKDTLAQVTTVLSLVLLIQRL
jgi:protein involved in polysaccharide export with SLBB domain